LTVSSAEYPHRHFLRLDLKRCSIPAMRGDGSVIIAAVQHDGARVVHIDLATTPTTRTFRHATLDLRSGIILFAGIETRLTTITPTPHHNV